MTFFVCSRMSLSLRVCSYFASRPDKLEKSLGDGDFKVIVMIFNILKSNNGNLFWLQRFFDDISISSQYISQYIADL